MESQVVPAHTACIKAMEEKQCYPKERKILYQKAVKALLFIYATMFL